MELITESLTSEGLIGGVAVGTAHVYQGQEKDIMIKTKLFQIA